MLLEEAIKHCEEKAKCGDSCGMEHKQLAEWLRELMQLRYNRAKAEACCRNGLLTLEDLVEAIMGNIQDEYDQEDEEISRIDDNTFTVDGTIDIEEIEELIGKELPEGDYETLAGFIIDQLQYLPKDGEMNEVEFENVKFTVLKVDERRIEKIKVEITPLPEVEDDDDEDEDD